jgi:hypothetical protein
MEPLHLNSLHAGRDCWWTIQRGIDRQPEMDTSPYRSDCTDHFGIAQHRTIDFSDTTRARSGDGGKARYHSAHVLRSVERPNTEVPVIMQSNTDKARNRILCSFLKIFSAPGGFCAPADCFSAVSEFSWANPRGVLQKGENCEDSLQPFSTHCAKLLSPRATNRVSQTYHCPRCHHVVYRIPIAIIHR